MTGQHDQLPITVVATTLGRVEALRVLLSSLAPQLTAQDQVVVVAQDRFAETRALVDSARSEFAASLIFETSSLGASRGRNVGVARSASSGMDDLLLFPNDTSWYPQGSVAALRSALGTAPAAGVTVETPIGERFTLPAAGTPLDRRNVWQVIEAGLVIRRSIFDSVGGFDESLGTGAQGPWQAGEVTDLLLRILRFTPGISSEFTWVPPDAAHVNGVEEGAGLTPREKAWKLRAYGRGIGHVYRVHRYPLVLRLAFIVAGALIGVRRRDEYPLSAGVPAFLGRLEGVTGHVLGRAPARAVSR